VRPFSIKSLPVMSRGFVGGVEVGDCVGGGAVEAAEDEVGGTVDASLAAEHLHHALAQFGPVELPADPVGSVEAVGGEGIVVAGIVGGDLFPLCDEPAEFGVIEVGPAGVPQTVGVRRHHAAEEVGVGFFDAGAVERDPGRDSAGAALSPDGFHDVVAAPERNGAAERLEVIAPAAAGRRAEHRRRVVQGV